MLTDEPAFFTQTPGTIEAPFAPLVRFWDRLDSVCDDVKYPEADRKDLKLLLATLSTASGDPKLDKYLSNRKNYQSARAISFEALWTIFYPGQLVVGKPFQGQEQVFVVANPGPADWSPSHFTIFCWAYDWDGDHFKRQPYQVQIKKFADTKAINSLILYPLELHKDSQNLREMLEKRGRKFRFYCTAKLGSQMFDYNHDAIFINKGISLDDEDDQVSLAQEVGICQTNKALTG